VAQQELNNSQQKAENEYSNKAANHQEQSKKNLTWKATKKLGKHGADAFNSVKNIFNGEKQTQ